jgi:outer membrane lipoprotein LolB
LQAGQPPRVAADIDTLMLETLGWPLPVGGLRYWLQGFATDKGGHAFVASPITQKSDHVTTSDGWHIRYASWQDSDNNVTPNYPKRIDLERFTTEAGDVSIKIVIDTWQLR